MAEISFGRDLSFSLDRPRGFWRRPCVAVPPPLRVSAAAAVFVDRGLVLLLHPYLLPWLAEQGFVLHFTLFQPLFSLVLSLAFPCSSLLLLPLFLLVLASPWKRLLVWCVAELWS